MNRHGSRSARSPWLVFRTCIALAALAGLGDLATAESLRVDFGTEAGTIRPLHGVNGGPLNFGETVDLSAHWRELATPLTRLHDCEWPNPDLVDMHAVFPDLAVDPESPASYRFSRTDTYLKAIVDAGPGIVYRLGESIEHTQTKYHVNPPGDFQKWAAACVGIIRHYNKGWADGFHYNIRYWEIWNEPENRPAMWTGTDADYYRLYATAAKAIKTRFPDLEVGGPSVGATGDVVDGRLQATPFLEGFLKYCASEQAPLDFFSWHTYCNDPYLYARKAKAIRRWLDDRGFSRAEIHLNEWNYLPDNDWSPMLAADQGIRRRQWYARMGGAEGAAFVTCVLVYLQDSPVDVVNLYSGDTLPFGLFDRFGAPKKTFFAVKAFKMLLDTPVRVKASGTEPGRTAVCAGLNPERTRATVLISKFLGTDEACDLVVDRLPWQGPTTYQAFAVDERHSLEPLHTRIINAKPVRLSLRLPAPGVLVVRLCEAPGNHDSPNTKEEQSPIQP